MDRAAVVRTLSAAPALRELISRVQAAVGPGLNSYNDRLRANPPGDSGKSLRDPLWGFIHLSAGEVAIVDSPVFQRLRNIRQLGLSYLVFPTAGYSRFEHSIGALNAADLMLTRLSETTDSNHRDVIQTNRQAIRLAALIHDIGHLPLSHVSERFYSEAECERPNLYRPSLRAITAIENVIRSDRPSLSECLSVAMVLTESFQELLRLSGYKVPQDIGTVIHCVLGHPWDLETAYLPQVISSFLDADKLDYMFRDSHVTGLPMALDLHRVMDKLRLVQFDMSVLPPDHRLRRLARAGDRPAVLAFEMGGEPLVADMLDSRSLLYDRIYLHHKTRAAEVIVLRMLEKLRIPITGLLKQDDWFFTASNSRMKQSDVRALSSLLIDRRLLRRAMAIPTAILAKHPQLNWNSATARRQIEADITALAERMGGYSAGNLPASIWVDSTPTRSNPDLSSLFIKRPGGLEPGQGGSVDPLPHTYVYVDGDQRFATLAFCATELYLVSHGVQIPESAAYEAKLDLHGAINNLKIEVEARAPMTYSSAGGIRSRSAFTRLPRNEQDIETIAARLATFDSGRRTIVDVNRVRDFLDQFPERLIPTMIEILRAFRFITSADFGVPFEGHLTSGVARKSAYVPLTEGFKSASLVAYNFGSIEPVTLDKALDASGDIVFFDDCIISGSQARSVVQTWFGDQEDLDESLAHRLTAPQLERLKQHNLFFRFVFGYEKGRDNLLRLCRAKGLRTAQVDWYQPTGLSLREAPGIPQRDEIIKFLRTVGYELLRSTKARENPSKWTDSLCRRRALGYGNDAQLVALFYNCPTGTMTPMWKEGTFRQIDWLPLLPRRERGVGRVG